MIGEAPASVRSAPETRPETSRYRAPQLRYVLIATGIVIVCFLLFLKRPYSVVSDTGYMALGARQYVDHYTAFFNTIRLVNPRDLAKDITTPLTDWAPGWAALFVIAFRTGFSAGNAGRLIALFIALAGAIGWVRVISILGLKGRWRLAGILLASLYCLRTDTVTKTGAGDSIVYAVAPWLFAAAFPLAISLGSRPRPHLIFRTALLSFALGSVYWLKYSGIFLSLAVFAAVVIEQFRGRVRNHALSSLLLLALFGAALAGPVLALKAYNYRSTGSDFLEASAHRSPPRSMERLVGFVSETIYNSAPVLFTADPGIGRIAGSEQSRRGWIVRLPGFVLLLTFFYLMWRRPSSYMRNVAMLSLAIPLIAMPALSFLGGQHFAFAIARLCEPYWIIAELLILVLLSETSYAPGSAVRGARLLLAFATGVQLLLFLWIPYESAREAWKIARTPRYDSSSAELWDTDLSKYGTREIDDRVRSLLRGPLDAIVPALYSDRAFATDTMLEFGGRMLPLSVMFTPLAKTHGRDGADYASSAPFVSSAPLRVVLVAPDPYTRSDFRASTERVMRRFPQVGEWTPVPVDPHGRVWVWTGEIR